MKRVIKLWAFFAALIAVVSLSVVAVFATEKAEDSIVSAEISESEAESDDVSFDGDSDDELSDVSSEYVGAISEDKAEESFISEDKETVVQDNTSRIFPSYKTDNTPKKEITVPVTEVVEKLSKGFLVSLKLFALTLLFALPLGLVVAFGSMSRFKPLAWLVRTFVWIIRGTPLMLQLFVVFYVPGWLFDMQVFIGDSEGRFNAALVAFVINYACYFSEIYRGGIQATPKGQYEAAQVLGMTPVETFFKVVLMQVVKRILAPMSNEVITLVKDTSLARVISVAEIFFVNNEEFLHYSIIWPLFFIAVYFLVFVGILTLFFGWWEKKLSYYKV